MDLHSIELVIIGGIIVATALVKLGSWMEIKLHGAQAREYHRIWFEEIRPIVGSESSWPPAGEAYEYFFERYDPAADAAEHIARMNADVRQYLEGMSHEQY